MINYKQIMKDAGLSVILEPRSLAIDLKILKELRYKKEKLEGFRILQSERVCIPEGWELCPFGEITDTDNFRYFYLRERNAIAEHGKMEVLDDSGGVVPKLCWESYKIHLANWRYDYVLIKRAL